MLAPPAIHESEDARLKRFLAALDPNFTARLQESELTEISEAFTRAFPVTTAMDVRLSFRWFFVRLIAGKERRSAARRSQDRRTFPALTWRNVPLLILFWLAVMALSVAAMTIIPPLMVGLFF